MEFEVNDNAKKISYGTEWIIPRGKRYNCMHQDYLSCGKLAVEHDLTTYPYLKRLNITLTICIFFKSGKIQSLIKRNARRKDLRIKSAETSQFQERL